MLADATRRIHVEYPPLLTFSHADIDWLLKVAGIDPFHLAVRQ